MINDNFQITYYENIFMWHCDKQEEDICVAGNAFLQCFPLAKIYPSVPLATDNTWLFVMYAKPHACSPWFKFPVNLVAMAT